MYVNLLVYMRAHGCACVAVHVSTHTRAQDLPVLLAAAPSTRSTFLPPVLIAPEAPQLLNHVILFTWGVGLRDFEGFVGWGGEAAV